MSSVDSSRDWGTHARIGAVTRIPAVARGQGAQALDPARRTDPRLIGPNSPDWPRPDVARIPIADITEFEMLVYGRALDGVVASADLHRSANSAASAWTGADITPADRISSTLRQLSRVPGL